MDQIFEHPVFDSAREKVKHAGKTTGTPLKPVLHLFQMWQQQYIYCCKTG